MAQLMPIQRADSRPRLPRLPHDGGGGMNEHLHTALRLAADGVPVLPLRRGKGRSATAAPARATRAAAGRT